MITIYHFNRCSKSRQALAILEEKGKPFQIRYYIEEPLNSEEIIILQQQLHLPLIELVRTNENSYKELFGTNTPDDSALIQAIVDYPILLQRPIVVSDDRAVIARPPERVLEIL